MILMHNMGRRSSSNEYPMTYIRTYVHESQEYPSMNRYRYSQENEVLHGQFDESQACEA